MRKVEQEQEVKVKAVETELEQRYLLLRQGAWVDFFEASKRKEIEREL